MVKIMNKKERKQTKRMFIPSHFSCFSLYWHLRFINSVDIFLTMLTFIVLSSTSSSSSISSISLVIKVKIMYILPECKLSVIPALISGLDWTLINEEEDEKRTKSKWKTWLSMHNNKIINKQDGKRWWYK